MWDILDVEVSRFLYSSISSQSRREWSKKSNLVFVKTSIIEAIIKFLVNFKSRDEILALVSEW